MKSPPYVAAAILVCVFLSIAPDGGSLVAAATDSSSKIDTMAVRVFAIDGIKEYPIVRDAAVTQKGDKLGLAVQVIAGTTVKAARQIGDNFVRMVKGACGDSPPRKEIGKGKYSYLITVFSGKKKIIAEGAKAKNATKITW